MRLPSVPLVLAGNGWLSGMGGNSMGLILEARSSNIFYGSVVGPLDQWSRLARSNEPGSRFVQVMIDQS